MATGAASEKPLGETGSDSKRDVSTEGPFPPLTRKMDSQAELHAPTRVQSNPDKIEAPDAEKWSLGTAQSLSQRGDSMSESHLSDPVFREYDKGTEGRSTGPLETSPPKRNEKDDPKFTRDEQAETGAALNAPR